MSSQPKTLDVIVVKAGTTTVEERIQLAEEITKEAIKQDVDKIHITFMEKETISETESGPN